jgi:hypothetical protein
MPKNIFDIKSFGIDLTFGFWHLTFVRSGISPAHIVDI